MMIPCVGPPPQVSVLPRAPVDRVKQASLLGHLSWTDVVVVHTNVAAIEIEAKLAHVLGMKGFSVRTVLCSLNHSGIVRSLVAHIQIALGDNLALLVSLMKTNHSVALATS